MDSQISRREIRGWVVEERGFDAAQAMVAICFNFVNMSMMQPSPERHRVWHVPRFLLIYFF